jgi:hypothetical protein
VTIKLEYDFGGKYPGRVEDDITLFYSRDTANADEAADYYKLSVRIEPRGSADLFVKTPWNSECRALACRSTYREKKYISVTLRDHDLERELETTPGKCATMLPECAAAPSKLARIIQAGRSAEAISGLIAVAGQTKSGKSYLADGLVREFLTWGGHLVALGTPVDCLPCEKGRHSQDPELTTDLAHVYRAYGIQYTPRVLGTDTDLEQALVDALRQKPSVLYLDEVRHETDWKHILRFAESGHLIITTTHSGSVRDALSWILKAMHVERRSQAPGVAGRILAIIHASLLGSPKRQYPEMWLGERGASQLGAYGPGALIPNNDANAAYLSRKHLAQHIYGTIVHNPGDCK